MGDHWEHEIRIEAVNPPPKKSYPTCIGGSGACPPEDCGGPHGYLERRDETESYDAWRDLNIMIGFFEEVVATDAPDRQVSDFLTADVENGDGADNGTPAFPGREVFTGCCEQRISRRRASRSDAPADVTGVFKKVPFWIGMKSMSINWFDRLKGLPGAFVRLERVPSLANRPAALRFGWHNSLQLFFAGICSWQFAQEFAFPDIDNGLREVEFSAPGVLETGLQSCAGECDGIVGIESSPVNNNQGHEGGEFAEDSDGILPSEGVDVDLL